MLILRRRGWEIPERMATSEGVFLQGREAIRDRLGRRAFLKGGAVLAGTAFGGVGCTPSADAQGADPTASLYPMARNAAYTIERPVTPEKITSNYNNFYEFGTSKRIASAAQALETRPWVLTIGGMVEKPLELGIDDLIKAMPLEERLYRHRCVEAWSMTIPWSGFPMRALLNLAKPLSSAKYVRMETFLKPGVAPLQKRATFPWPYVEGVTIAEAANDLAFLVIGAYGKPLLKQYGAPLRLALPWKYGFKSIKSIVRFEFTDKRPKSFWEEAQGSEYGFWANVNPEVAHRRWSQADEEDLETGRRIPTQVFNGYAPFVADLYKGLEHERLWA